MGLVNHGKALGFTLKQNVDSKILLFLNHVQVMEYLCYKNIFLENL